MCVRCTSALAGAMPYISRGPGANEASVVSHTRGQLGAHVALPFCILYIPLASTNFLQFDAPAPATMLPGLLPFLGRALCTSALSHCRAARAGRTLNSFTAYSGCFEYCKTYENLRLEREREGLRKIEGLLLDVGGGQALRCVYEHMCMCVYARHDAL